MRHGEHRILGLLRVSQLFTELRPEINLSLFSALMAATLKHPGDEQQKAPTIRELSDFSGVPYTSMSRHLRYLGDGERGGKPGLKLVEVWENPENKREKLVRLSEEGEGLRDKVLALL